MTERDVRDECDHSEQCCQSRADSCFHATPAAQSRIPGKNVGAPHKCCDCAPPVATPQRTCPSQDRSSYRNERAGRHAELTVFFSRRFVIILARRDPSIDSAIEVHIDPLSKREPMLYICLMRRIVRFQREHVPYARKDRRNQKRCCAPAW